VGRVLWAGSPRPVFPPHPSGRKNLPFQLLVKTFVFCFPKFLKGKKKKIFLKGNFKSRIYWVGARPPLGGFAPQTPLSAFVFGKSASEVGLRPTLFFLFFLFPLQKLGTEKLRKPFGVLTAGFPFFRVVLKH